MTEKSSQKETEKQIACLILAAGSSSRFGGRKQLADVSGAPMIQHTIRQIKACFDGTIFCVVGAYGDEVAVHITSDVEVIKFANWQEGMGASIAHGVKTIRQKKEYDGILIAVVDQVALTCEDYKKLITPFDGNAIVASHYGGRCGVPALFPPSYFNQLEKLSGDRGAQSLLKDAQNPKVLVPMALAEFDIDTPHDLILFENKIR